MSFLLSCHSLGKSFSSQLLFRDLSFDLSPRERVALIGANGTGKSTLLKMIYGQETIDQGTIHFSNDLTVGYLPQEIDLSEIASITAGQYVDNATGNIALIAHKLQQVESQLSDPTLSEEQLQPLLEQYDGLQQEMEQKDGYDFDHQLQTVLTGLSLQHIDVTRTLSTLSGGELARLTLATLLLSSFDLLLLDEPTNHLDMQGLMWLESFLDKSRFAMIVVSHDRRFLDNMMTTFMEWDPLYGLVRFKGKYGDYLMERERQRKRHQKEYEQQKKEIKQLQSTIKSATFSAKAPGRQKDSFSAYHNAHRERQERGESTHLRQAKKQLDDKKNNPILPPSQPTVIGIHFTPHPLASSCVIALKQLSFFSSRLNREINKGERICITGPNGSGKTTLLKMILQEMPYQGEVKIAPTARLGYLSQHFDHLTLSNTLLQEYGKGRSADETTLRKELAKVGLFGDAKVHTLVSNLSAGQKQKLQIARLIALQANVLLLDEPTNHLDINTREQLEKAINNFDGVVLAVSHDRWFIDTIATDCWEFASLLEEK